VNLYTAGGEAVGSDIMGVGFTAKHESFDRLRMMWRLSALL